MFRLTDGSVDRQHSWVALAPGCPQQGLQLLLRWAPAVHLLLWRCLQPPAPSNLRSAARGEEEGRWACDGEALTTAEGFCLLDVEGEEGENGPDAVQPLTHACVHAPEPGKTLVPWWARGWRGSAIVNQHRGHRGTRVHGRRRPWRWEDTGGGSTLPMQDVARKERTREDVDPVGGGDTREVLVQHEDQCWHVDLCDRCDLIVPTMRPMQ